MYDSEFYVSPNVYIYGGVLKNSDSCSDFLKFSIAAYEYSYSNTFKNVCMSKGVRLEENKNKWLQFSRGFCLFFI